MIGKLSNGDSAIIKGQPHLAKETQDEVFSHRCLPSRGGQNEGMASPRLFCVDIKLLGLASGLGAGPCDDGDVLESMGIKDSPSQTNDTFPLVS
jgi:hypothetical protein